jgi:hypothetical protein
MKLLMDLYKSIMSLATDGGIVERAMKIVKGLELQSTKQTITQTEEESKEDFQDDQEPTSTPIEPEEDLKEEE